MNIAIIAAVAKNGAIGNDNKLIYWLPNDLKRFKELTTGHTIIMGSNTFRSLPKGALPNRRNVVLTCKGGDFPGAEQFTSLDEALQSCAGEETVYIIGGEMLYRYALPYADTLELTEVDDTPSEADAFFPTIDNCWQLMQSEPHDKDEKHAYNYTFVTYKKSK